MSLMFQILRLCPRRKPGDLKGSLTSQLGRTFVGSQGLVVLGNQALTKHSLETSAKRKLLCSSFLFSLVAFFVCFLLLELLWMQIVLNSDLTTVPSGMPEDQNLAIDQSVRHQATVVVAS